MPNGELCSCLHGKTNHKVLQKNLKINRLESEWLECFYDNCPCEKYEFYKLAAPNKANYQDSFVNKANLVWFNVFKCPNGIW